MKISVMTSTGDDDPINAEEKGDLEYRRQQLKRLQEEVVDIEEMSSGISIMDLGLNEFRLDLLEYMKHHHDVEITPHGMHAVVPAREDASAGAIFVLRNVNDSVNVDHRTASSVLHGLHWYGWRDPLRLSQPKQMLDTIRLLCRGRTEPISDLYREFNQETDDGRTWLRCQNC